MNYFQNHLVSNNLIHSVVMDAGPLTLPSGDLHDLDAGEHINIIKIEKTNEPLGEFTYCLLSN